MASIRGALIIRESLNIIAVPFKLLGTLTAEGQARWVGLP